MRDIPKGAGSCWVACLVPGAENSAGFPETVKIQLVQFLSRIMQVFEGDGHLRETF